LLDAVTAVVAELSYAPLYAGERLFPDVADLLAAHGLQFVTAVQDMTVQPYRVPIGLRGNDWRVQIDGLFLRRIETVERDPVALRKLAFAAHFFSQNAYGYECLRRYVAKFGSDFGAAAYGRFLADLVAAETDMPHEPSLTPAGLRTGLDPLLGVRDTPVEAVFRRYGLGAQADAIKHRRQSDVVRYLQTRGMTVTVRPA
jgi:hypothetical protein